MDKKSIQKMSDVRLAALEGWLDDISYYASDEEKESLMGLYRRSKKYQRTLGQSPQ